MKRAAWALVLGAMVGWAAVASPMVEALRPEIALSMEADGAVRIRCSVTPVGPAGFIDRVAELNWSLVPQVGSWRIVAAFAEVLSLTRGEVKVFTDWRIRLPAGEYTLAWGDACEGWVTATFVVREDEIGRRVLMSQARFLSPSTPLAVAVADEPAWTADSEARRVAAWAHAALADHLAVCARTIEVTDVLARDSSDTSLGVREPGMMYAQVITPGYVVRLRWGDREFEYRAAGSVLVRVPDIPSGRVPDEVWVVQIFAYHAGVDQLLHGYLACSPAAVLPLPRWIPAGTRPMEGTLRLLLGHGLAPWEAGVGYSSEFPLARVSLKSVRFEDGVVVVTLVDPEHKTSGGACRTGILRAQIERTALQFPEVHEVRFLPPEVLQP